MQHYPHYLIIAGTGRNTGKTSIATEIIRRFEGKGEALTAGQEKWLAGAKEALPVPETLVKTMREYSHNPADLYAYRNRLADMIDRSGVRDCNPWGSHFTVRGFGPRRP